MVDGGMVYCQMLEQQNDVGVVEEWPNGGMNGGFVEWCHSRTTATRMAKYWQSNLKWQNCREVKLMQNGIKVALVRTTGSCRS